MEDKKLFEALTEEEEQPIALKTFRTVLDSYPEDSPIKSALLQSYFWKHVLRTVYYRYEILKHHPELVKNGLDMYSSTCMLSMFSDFEEDNGVLSNYLFPSYGTPSYYATLVETKKQKDGLFCYAFTPHENRYVMHPGETSLSDQDVQDILSGLEGKADTVFTRKTIKPLEAILVCKDKLDYTWKGSKNCILHTCTDYEGEGGCDCKSMRVVKEGVSQFGRVFSMIESSYSDADWNRSMWIFFNIKTK